MAITVSSVSPSSAVTHGRREDVWGRRRIGLYRLTPDSSWLGTGEAIDWKAYGFQGPVASVFLTQRATTSDPVDGSVQFFWNPTNATIQAWDYTAGDNADGDDLSGIIIDALVIGE